MIARKREHHVYVENPRITMIDSHFLLLSHTMRVTKGNNLNL